MSFGRYLSPRITELEKKLKRDPSSLIFVQLAEEYRRAGAFEDAVRICREGLAKHPNYVSANMLLGRVHFDTRRFKESRVELEKVISSSPENLMAHRMLGDIHWMEESWELAEKRYRMVFLLNPADLECRQRLQTLEMKLRERERVREMADRARQAPSKVDVGAEPAPIPGQDVPLIDIQTYGESAATGEESETLPASALEEATEQTETTATQEPPSVEASMGSMWLKEAAAGPGSLPASPVQAVESPAEPEPAKAVPGGETGALEPLLSEEISAPAGFFAIEDTKGQPESGEPRVLGEMTSPFYFPEAISTEPGPVPQPALQEAASRGTTPAGGGRGTGESPEHEIGESAPPVAEGLATATLAELYASQGHLERAIAVYRQLSERAPDDQDLLRKIDGISARLAGSAGPQPGPRLTAPEKVAILRSWLAEVQRNRRAVSPAS